MKTPKATSLANHEIVTLAVYLLGGDAQRIDTEDVAVKANALAAEFDWGITRDVANKRYAQFAEGVPGLTLDESARAIWFDSEKAQAGIEEVYEKYLAQDLEFFRISKGRAAGLYEFLDILKNTEDISIK